MAPLPHAVQPGDNARLSAAPESAGKPQDTSDEPVLLAPSPSDPPASSQPSHLISQSENAWRGCSSLPGSPDAWSVQTRAHMGLAAQGVVEVETVAGAEGSPGCLGLFNTKSGRGLISFSCRCLFPVSQVTSTLWAQGLAYSGPSASGCFIGLCHFPFLPGTPAASQSPPMQGGLRCLPKTRAASRRFHCWRGSLLDCLHTAGW